MPEQALQLPFHDPVNLLGDGKYGDY